MHKMLYMLYNCYITYITVICPSLNRTHLDFECRGLLAVGTVVDWNNLRTVHQEINNLFASRIGSNREQIAVNNLIVEFRVRAAHLLPLITD